eukprot:236513-Amphidinium_carterae.1
MGQCPIHPAPPSQPALENQKQIVPIRVIPESIPSDSNAEENVEDDDSVGSQEDQTWWQRTVPEQTAAQFPSSRAWAVRFQT